MCCNNERCGKTAALSVAHEAFIARETLLERRGDPPEPSDNPDVDSTPESEGPHQMRYQARAFTAVSIAVEATMLRCHNCGAAHRTWQCPEIHELLSGSAVYETQELIFLWSVSRALLIAKLTRLTAPQLTIQACDFAAWLNDQTHLDLPATSVLAIWEHMIAGTDFPPRSAAPAMRMVA